MEKLSENVTRFYNEQIYVGAVNLLKFSIARFVHYGNNSLSSSYTYFHKHDENDSRKTSC